MVCKYMFAVCLALLCSLVLFARGTTADIVGTVVDNTGAEG